MSGKNENIKILQRKIDYQHAELVDVRKINTKLRSELAACKAERDALQARIDGADKAWLVTKKDTSYTAVYFDDTWKQTHKRGYIVTPLLVLEESEE